MFYGWENHWNAISYKPQRFNFTLLLKKKYLSRHVSGCCDYDAMAQLVTWKRMFTRHRQSYFQLLSCRDSQVSFKKLPSWLHVCTMLNRLLRQFLPAGRELCSRWPCLSDPSQLPKKCKENQHNYAAFSSSSNCPRKCKQVGLCQYICSSKIK